jgi:hypothetical protein
MVAGVATTCTQLFAWAAADGATGDHAVGTGNDRQPVVGVITPKGVSDGTVELYPGAEGAASALLQCC